MGKRLKAAAGYCTANHDVEGLCREFPQRMCTLVEVKKGDRLHKLFCDDELWRVISWVVQTEKAPRQTHDYLGLLGNLSEKNTDYLGRCRDHAMVAATHPH